MAIEQRHMRRVDIANVSVNIVQLAAIIGAVVTATMAWDHLSDRIGDFQSQIGEMNARMGRLERK